MATIVLKSGYAAQLNSSECGDLTPGHLPVTDEYLKSLGTGYIVALSLCIIITAIVVCSYTESALFLVQHFNNWRPKDRALLLLGLYPIFCITSTVALIVPRSATFNDMVSNLYLAGCVYSFVAMLMGHFGGQEKMSKRLVGTFIPLQSPPFCCCCFCLPSLTVTRNRLWGLEMTVLQYVIVKPILAYIAAVLWSDDKYISEEIGVGAAYTWINVISMASTLLALYGFMMVYQMSRAPLQKMCVKPKFLVLQLVLIISNFQHVIISFLVLGGLIQCDPPLTGKANGDRWHHILLIMEMFILSWFARSYYRRHMDEIPAEDEMVATIVDNDTMTTDSLARGLTAPYGTLGNTIPNHGYSNSIHRSSDPPLVLLNQQSNNVTQRVATTNKYRSSQYMGDDEEATGVETKEIAIQLSKGTLEISSDA